MLKEEPYQPEVGEPVRIIYSRVKKEEIGVYLRTDSGNYVFSGVEKGEERFVSRHHVRLEKLAKKDLKTIVSQS